MFSRFRRNDAAPVASDGLALRVGMASDIGQVRTENQDAVGAFPEDEPRVFVVCDGMGGHEDGSRASNMALERIRAMMAATSDDLETRLEAAVKAANHSVYRSADSQDVARRMGTTCSALAIHPQHVVLAHVGDSRVYRVTSDAIEQLSHDHTVAAEMLASGMLSAEEAERHPRKHALTRALGSAPSVEVMVRDLGPPREGERFLLCSDGLAPVPTEEIQRATLAYEPQEAVEWLITQANARGGHDNVTVLIVEVGRAA